VQLKQKNSKKQGDVGMGVAIGYFAARGITVCIPLTDSQDYDLVIDLDDVLKKVQVKTTTSKAGTRRGYDVHLRVPRWDWPIVRVGSLPEADIIARMSHYWLRTDRRECSHPTEPGKVQFLRGIRNDQKLFVAQLTNPKGRPEEIEQKLRQLLDEMLESV
jgi:hypothetical protein